jgi:glycosyltransferase involved in cell wall biosynthesis
MKIAFIDTFGLCYDGTTLTKRGLGGSESAVILCSRELAKIGFDVTVFNDCIHDDTQPGIYDGVLYRPLSEVETTTDNYDVIIGSRSIAAFAPAYMRERFKTFSYMPDFTNIQHRARHKVLWMHDTFCDGDDLIDVFLLDGLINEVFVLSDFHMDYVTNCDHGKKRMFEVMKKYMYVTRNGMTKYHDWVDITKKDPNHFVYNASVTKGMRPLVYKIWPRIRQLIPDAKLTVIGGYYRMRDKHEPNEQEVEWYQMVDNNPDINFTGIIKQSEIADILCDASYMIYPAEFPETFGISTLESLAYNTPLITCDFGALEETAFDAACYKIPYPIAPNGLFPYVNEDEQVERFVNLVIKAYNDKYLHQQKMYACNAVKDICGWDSVAMQWKQHFFHKLGVFLPVGDYREAQEINYKVRKTFGRRFINQEELQPPCNIQKEIGIITAVYNAENYIEKCILSVAQQNYKWYTMYIVDDASTDNTVSVARRTIDSLPQEIRHNFVLILNDENVGAVANHYKVINEYIGVEDIFMILDGDDWLVNNPNIFHYYNNLYHEGAEFTYGSCWSLADNIPLVAQPYPPEVKANKDYRNHKFNWNMPYTHLRTFHPKLLRDLTEDNLKVNGQWPKAGGDTALFYYLIEKADPEKVICVTDIVYIYNDKNPLNDYKINGDEQTNTANVILSKPTVKKRFTVVVPTMWKYEPFKDFLNKLLECDDVGEVILIDNDPTRTPLELKCHIKLRYKTFGSNIFVNPAWNYGVENASYDYVCILNDDMKFDLEVFNGLRSVLDDPNTGVCGIIPGIEHYNQIPVTDGNYQIIPWQVGMHQFGFGCLMFVNKNSWTHIPDDLKIYYGDYFIFDKHLASGRTNYCIVNLKHETPYAQTCSDMYNKDAERMAQLQAREGEIYESVKHDMWCTPQPVNNIDTPEVYSAEDINLSHGPTYAYVIRTPGDQLSAEYANIAEKSARSVGLIPYAWNGYNKSNFTIETLSEKTGFKFGNMDIGAACASASHFNLWRHIASLPVNDPIVILEHDALMLHPIKDLLSDNYVSSIIALGYKLTDPNQYNHEAAGAPREIIPCNRHSGAHAYMITPNTARQLLKELIEKGAERAIDNFYFMRCNEPGDTESDVPLSLMVPTPAVGWLRKSTIWDAPSTLNYDEHESFRSHLRW